MKLPIVHNDWRKETNKGNDDNSLPWKTEEATTNQHHHHPRTIVMKWNGSYLVPRQSITNKFKLIRVIRHIRHLCLSVQRMAMHKALVTWKIEPFSLYPAEWYSGLACCDIGLPSFFMRLEPSSNTSQRSFTHLDKQVSLKQAMFYQCWVSLHFIRQEWVRNHGWATEFPCPKAPEW